MARTTQRHYGIFKKTIKYWLGYFGLSEWRVTTFHQSNSAPGAEHARASYIAYSEDRICSIFLEPDWKDNIVTDELVERSAFHEVVHVLLCWLTYLALQRSTTAQEIDEAEHVIIHRLQSAVFGNIEEGEFE
jgi:hypothetical protein